MRRDRFTNGCAIASWSSHFSLLSLTRITCFAIRCAQLLGQDSDSFQAIRSQPIDVSVVKLTTLTERTKLEFRAECFNLANHANFGLPSNSISSSNRAVAGTAGVITTTVTDNRELQLGLKLLF